MNNRLQGKGWTMATFATGAALLVSMSVLTGFNPWRIYIWHDTVEDRLADLVLWTADAEEIHEGIQETQKRIVDWIDGEKQKDLLDEFLKRCDACIVKTGKTYDECAKLVRVEMEAEASR